MRAKRIVPLTLVVLVATACVTTSSRFLRSEFEDIPVPKGLAYVDSQSVVIESPSVKAARLIYRGRIEVGSLAVAMRTMLEANGWRAVSNTSAATHGTTQVYEKAGNSLQVRLWEGWYYTYVEMTASRALQSSSAAAK
jgi:hypothetical protein